jgi:hypothetical protein
LLHNRKEVFGGLCAALCEPVDLNVAVLVFEDGEWGLAVEQVIASPTIDLEETDSNIIFLIDHLIELLNN